MKKKISSDILLVMPPPWGVDIPPLGLAALSVYLRNKGFQTEIFDFNIYLYNKASLEYKEVWEMGAVNRWRKEPFLSHLKTIFDSEINYCAGKIISSGCKIVGFSVPANSSERIVAEIIKRIKKKNKDIKIILGGASISIKEQRAFFTENIPELIDAYVIGEGESPLLEILTRLKRGKDINDIPRILIHPEKGDITFFPAKEEDFSQLPIPTFEEFDLSVYKVNGKSLPMEWSRGCIGNCKFCDFKVISKQYRSRTPQVIAEAVKFYKTKYDINHLSLIDPTINGNFKNLEEICELLIGRNNTINFSGLAMPRKEMSLELLKKMKAAGFNRMEYGVESGSNSVLKEMGKICTTEDSERALKLTHQAGIMTVIYLMVGFPGETEDEFEKTLEFLEKNSQFIDYVKSVNPFYLMAGSYIYEHHQDYDITMPGEDPDFKWRQGEVNTYQIRVNRVERIRRLLENLDVNHFTEDNLFERDVGVSKLYLLRKSKPIPPLSYEMKRQIDTNYRSRDISKYLNESPADILLLMCPAWDYKMPPVGLAYLVSYLKHNGLNPKVLDLNVKIYNIANESDKCLWHTRNVRCWMEGDIFNNIFRKFKDHIDGYVKKISSANIQLIGFTVLRSNLKFTVEVAKQIKNLNKDIKIIFGGHSSSIEGERKFVPSGLVDAFVIGEGEETLCDIVKMVKKRKELTEIPGALICKDGEYLKFSERPSIKNLDSIPYPAYSEFDLPEYYSKTMPLMGSRGCLRKCSFCDELYWRGYRTRSAEHIFNEIEHHFKNYGVKDFKFNDLACNFNLNELENLCDLIISSGYKITWLSDAVVRTNMSFDIFRKMKQSGCYVLRWGIESGSAEVLKKMRKGFIIEEAEEILKISHKAGILNFINIIAGFPGETEENFQQTVEFLRRNEKFIAAIPSLSVCHITPNSDLERNPDKYGIILPKENHWYTWFGLDGNTDALRKQRLSRLVSVIQDSNIGLDEEFSMNLYERYKTEWIQKTKAPTQNKAYKSSPVLKKANIFLVMCPPWGVNMPPLGLACLSIYLGSKGFDSEILDLNIEVYNHLSSEYKKLWKTKSLDNWRFKERFQNLLREVMKGQIDYCVKRLLSTDTPVLGFSVNRANLRFTLEVVKKIKVHKPQAIIIFGGPSTSLEGERKIIPENLVDAFIIGEGEKTLYEVLRNLREGNSLNNIPGVLIPGSDKFIPRRLIEDLSLIPFPTYQEFDLSRYGSASYRLPIATNRGCPRSCLFCNENAVWNHKFRYREAAHVFAEIKYHVEKWGVRNFEFMDSSCNGNLLQLELLIDLLIKSKYRIKWLANIMIRPDMTFHLFRKMKDSGCVLLRFGIESGSPLILKKMNKGFKIQHAEAILKMSYGAGIENHINLIVGFPGEGEAEFEETIDFLKRNSRFITRAANIFPCYLTPGSRLEKEHKKYGIVLPERNFAVDWYDNIGNTYRQRNNKIDRLVAAASDLDIELDESGVCLSKQILPAGKQQVQLNKRKIEAKQSDIILVTFPPWGVNNPPIGLAYLAPYLKKNGFLPVVYDFNVYFYNSAEERYKMLWHVENKSYWSNEKSFPLVCDLFKVQIDYCVEKILNTPVNLIGFSVVDPKERITIEVIKRIKKKDPSRKIILGGPACSTESQRDIFLKNVGEDIEAFVVGEGEGTLLEIIKRVNEGKNLVGLEGAVTKGKNSWISHQRNSLNIDEIIFPNYEEFNLNEYNSKTLLVEWSRGCIGRCSFCKNYRLVPGYRMKKAKDVVDELSYHAGKNGITEFTVCDSLLNGNLQELSRICDLIVEKNLKIKWSGQIAPWGNMEFGLFDKMKQAGCSTLQIGLESGSDKVLRNMRKIYSSQDAEDVIRQAKQAGIETEVFTMIGFPGEGEKEFQETANFIERNAGYIDAIKSINTLHLIAGTDVYENFRNYRMKTLPQENWHYLWKAKGRNTYKVRRQRAEKLLNLAYKLGISVMETNIAEGKEGKLAKVASFNRETLIQEINQLSSLKTTYPKIKRTVYKKLLLLFIFTYTLFISLYLWLIKKFKKIVVFGSETE